MALFGKKNDELDRPVPPQRVKGFADLDLKKLVESSDEFEMIATEDVDWDVEYESDDVVRASGYIKVPVEIKFEVGDIENETVADDLVVLNIKIAGSKVLVSDLEKAKIPFNPLDTIDTGRVEDLARKSFGADHID